MSSVPDIHSSLASHIREEEEDIFPRIREVWGETRLKRAGAEMEVVNSKKRRPVA
jgi:hemerythrin superfamily protein